MGVTIGLVGAGAMGSALGASWRAGGNRVQTCLDGRSTRTVSLVKEAGIEVLPSLDGVVAADLVVSVVPPGVAVAVARRIADAARGAGSAPLVVDLNAISPTTLTTVAAELDQSGLELVDGVISGAPPRPGGTRTMMYLSGPRAAEVAQVTSPWHPVTLLGEQLGAASALKMTTSSMYKGTNALVMQAMLTASHFGVLEAFLADVSRVWPQSVPQWPRQTALAATKASRFADEMHEIAITQAQAGLPPELFTGVAEVFDRASHSRLGQLPPESIDQDMSLEEILEQLAPKSGRCHRGR